MSRLALQHGVIPYCPIILSLDRLIASETLVTSDFLAAPIHINIGCGRSAGFTRGQVVSFVYCLQYY